MVSSHFRLFSVNTRAFVSPAHRWSGRGAACAAGHTTTTGRTAQRPKASVRTSRMCMRRFGTTTWTTMCVTLSTNSVSVGPVVRDVFCIRILFPITVTSAGDRRSLSCTRTRCRLGKGRNSSSCWRSSPTCSSSSTRGGGGIYTSTRTSFLTSLRSFRFLTLGYLNNPSPSSSSLSFSFRFPTSLTLRAAC